MTDQTLSLRTPAAKLIGTLTLPDAEAPAPAVLWLPDGTHERDGSTAEALADIAGYCRMLAAAGWASFRFDARGTGESTGVPSGDFAARLADAKAALDGLKGQPGVAADRIVVGGHTVGGGIACYLVKPGEAVAAILLNPSVRDETLLDVKAPLLVALSGDEQPMARRDYIEHFEQLVAKHRNKRSAESRTVRVADNAPPLGPEGTFSEELTVGREQVGPALVRWLAQTDL